VLGAYSLLVRFEWAVRVWREDLERGDGRRGGYLYLQRGEGGIAECDLMIVGVRHNGRRLSFGRLWMYETQRGQGAHVLIVLLILEMVEGGKDI
jgi:hypothetical protein